MEKVKLEREREREREIRVLLSWDQLNNCWTEIRRETVRSEMRSGENFLWGEWCVCVFFYCILDRDEVSLVLSDLIVIGLLCGSQQLEFFYKLNLFLITWKLTKLVFSFHCYNSIFWVMRYKNWKQKWNQTREPEVGPTKFENWVMKMAKSNTPLLSSFRA